MTNCPNCGTELVNHDSAGKHQYKDYPDLKICPVCWNKYNPQPDGTLVHVKNPKKQAELKRTMGKHTGKR